MEIADSVIDLVGNTPLGRINRLAQGCRVPTATPRLASWSRLP